MKRILLLSVVMLCFMVSAIAQRTVSGTVTSADDGSTMPGVNVVLKGTTTGVQTDLDGNFRLSVPEDGGILVFTFVGLATQEVEIGARSVVDVEMNEDVEQLAEVVIAGYRPVRKSDLTSSISTVTGDEVQAQPIGSIDNLLQGTSPGVQVVAQNGAPGSNAYIRVRGIGSVNASNEPLFVVDGIQLTQAQYNAINPNDIKEISVLKDAAATSIYGARASNGVVLVTTRNGSGVKKPTVTYRHQRGTKEMIPLGYDLMNKEQKLDYEVEVGLRTAESAEALRTSPAAPDTDWQDILLREGQVITHDLSFSGKTESASYFFSFGTYEEEGITVGSQFSRISGRSNVEFKLTDWLTFGNNLTIAQTKDNELRDRNNVQNPFSAIFSYNPYEPEFNLDAEGNPELDANGDPTYNLTRQGFSISEALRNNPEESRRTTILGSVYAQLNPIDGLIIRSTYGGNLRTRNREYYITPGSVLDGYVGNPSAPGIKTDNNDLRYQYNITNTASYDFSPIDGHSVNVLVGTEFIFADIRTSFLTSRGFGSDRFTTQDNASLVDNGSTTRDQWSLWSQFGQISYNMNEKYLATASIRRDGSSRFGADEQFGVFWAASAGWNVHEEGFLSNIREVSQLKIRGSLGTSGNLPNALYGNRGFFGFVSYNDEVATGPSQLENTQLKWENNFNYSVGFDFGFLNNRVSGAFDYYNRTTNDLLFNAPVSRTTGWDTRLANIGEIENTGVEIELAVDVVRSSDFNFTINGSLATNDNKVVALDNGGEDIINANSGITVLREDMKLNTYYLVRSAGVNPANGEELFYDIDGNVTSTWSGDDAVALEGKTPLPTFFGNFGFNASFKGLSLTTLFFYQGGNYVYNFVGQGAMLNNGGSRSLGNQRVDATNFWREPGDTGVLPKPGPGYNNNASDRLLQKGDFIRLRNVMLSYSLPKVITDKVKLANVEVYVQGTNLWTYNPYFTGDPEVGRGSEESNLELLGEYTLFTYPNTQGVTFGINVSL